MYLHKKGLFSKNFKNGVFSKNMGLTLSRNVKNGVFSWKTDLGKTGQKLRKLSKTVLDVPALEGTFPGNRQKRRKNGQKRPKSEKTVKTVTALLGPGDRS